MNRWRERKVSQRGQISAVLIVVVVAIVITVIATAEATAVVVVIVIVVRGAAATAVIGTEHLLPAMKSTSHVKADGLQLSIKKKENWVTQTR